MQLWESQPSTPFYTLSNNSRPSQSFLKPLNGRASTLYYRSCSLRPKCVSPTETTTLTERASKIPSSSIQKTEDDTKGREIIQFQEYHKVKWQEYTFQEVVDSMAVESIIADVNAQYAEELEEDYVGYKIRPSRR